MTAKHVCFVSKKHAICCLGSSQSCPLVRSMNVFEKEKNVYMFFLKTKTKEREEHI